MSDIKQINAKENSVNSAESDGKTAMPGTEISESRRRIAKAGLLAPSILMSVTSRPVLGWGRLQCLSKALSGNLSGPGEGTCYRGYGGPWWWWYYHFKSYCHDQKYYEQIFSTVFTSNGPYGQTTGQKMDEIICEYQIKKNQNQQISPDLKVQAYFAAAYLNVVNPPPEGPYVLSLGQLKHLWDGDFVHIADVITFLKSTWNDDAWRAYWQ